MTMKHKTRYAMYFHAHANHKFVLVINIFFFCPVKCIMLILLAVAEDVRT